MRTRIQKWGNSLAVRIPKSFATEARLEQDAVVELSLVDGRLVMVPVTEPEVTLEQLLAGITKENRHDEIDWGPAVGKEAW
jgi:antitoxin MazE